MQGVWLDRWIGIRIGRWNLGFWRGCTGYYRASSEAEVAAKKALALAAAGVSSEQVDGVRYRWQVVDLPVLPAKEVAA